MSLLAGHYELLDEVGEGPVGVLRLARVRGAGGFSRQVAVRTLHPELAADRRFVTSWAETASALARIGSPHVEQVLDVVADRGGASLVSEWIDGVSVAALQEAYLERVEDVPWPLAVEIAVQLLRGLATAHPMRHDAIGERSVRIARDGTVKLIRFGAAAALEETGAGRRRREELGLRHPAPELIDGAEASAATDQFGVGTLLFTLLAGEPPYEEDPGAARDLAVMRDLPDLSPRRPDVPPLLVATIERATRMDPADRFDTVARMERALRQLLRSSPVPTGPAVLADAVEAIASLDVSEDELEAAPEPPVEARPKGLPTTATMHVDMDELTELAPPPLSPSAAAGLERRARPYDFDYKRRAASLAEDEELERTVLAPPPVPRDLELPDDEEEPEPLPLTTRSGEQPLGIQPAKTEHLDAAELGQLTLEDEPEPPPMERTKRTSVRVPLGLGAVKTEYLQDGELEELRIDDE